VQEWLAADGPGEI